MSFINNIISWFKSTFGITPEKKSERESDSDFEVMDDLSITATLAERITVLATVDSTVEVVGNNMRANFLNKYMQWIVNTKLAAISEICLGTGDCLARPNTNGNRIGIDIIQNKFLATIWTLSQIRNPEISFFQILIPVPEYFLFIVSHRQKSFRATIRAL